MLKIQVAKLTLGTMALIIAYNVVKPKKAKSADAAK